MEVDFDDADLSQLETDAKFTGGFPPEAVRGFRKALQAVRAAIDERDLRNGGMRMEKLKGAMSGLFSIRLNKQWRLILRIEKALSGGNKAVLLRIEDYH